MTKRRKCTDLGGLYHSMKLTTVCGIIGALSISAFPLTSGFVSKSMISTAAADEHLMVVWLLLAAASAGVFLHAGIKFPWFVFFNRDSGLRPKDPPLNMKLAMVVFSLLCIIPGIFPGWLYAMLPAAPEYTPNTPDHVVMQLQLLLFSGLAFFVMLPMLRRTDTISLDSDWFYRVFVLNLLRLIDKAALFIGKGFAGCGKAFAEGAWDKAGKINGPGGILARNWPIGTTVMWIILLLGMSLVLYYTGL
jgi:multicomponent Na+:H+ antiporter subunit D